MQFVNVCVLAASSDQAAVVTDSLHQLDGHSSRVMCLSWSLHQDALLATASYDWLSLVLSTLSVLQQPFYDSLDFV